MNQIPWSIPLGKGVNHLLRYPFRVRMFGDCKVKYLPAPVFEHHEHEYHPQTDGGYSKEIRRNDLPQVVP
jgi:hypothetical protein